MLEMTRLWTTEDMMALTHGQTSSRWTFTNIAKDSKLAFPGSAFIALKGSRTDGHFYLNEALLSGAEGCIVERIPEDVQEKKCFVVQDTLIALQNLAKHARLHSRASVIAITGSLGKTSIKDNLTRVLLLCRGGKISSSERSFNNHWGVPYTLVNHDPGSDFLVVEIGMNHKGEIENLSQIAKPDIALITTIAEMHIGNLGSLEEIAKTKSEIFLGMKTGGVAVLNRDMNFYELIAYRALDHGLDLVTFGWHRKSDFKVLRTNYSSPTSQEVTLSAIGTNISYTIPTSASHWSTNSAAILAISHILGIPLNTAAHALTGLTLPEGRGLIHHIPISNGEFFTLIDESYNAGPTSIRSALGVLKRISPGPKGRRIAILGNMNELGSYASDFYKILARDLLNSHIDLLFTVGPEAREFNLSSSKQIESSHSDDLSSLLQKILPEIRKGDVILVKGSKNQYADRGWLYKIVSDLLNYPNCN